MCCPGCRAVAGLIAANGLESFYQQRTAFSDRPQDSQPDQTNQYQIYDDPELAAQFCEVEPDGLVTARLLLGGVTCAACTWLIEQSLTQHVGVQAASVNLQQSRLTIAFDPKQLKRSDIFSHVEALGYRPRPFQASTQREQMTDEYRRDMRRLGVAGFGMMQVGMFAVALHAGDIQGMEDKYQSLLRGVSLLVASFVVYYSASTFFSTAWRHLKQGVLVMDLPVALAIGLAWIASTWATLSGTGQVYFDSVVMFTFFLLLGRFLEQRVRQRHALNWSDTQGMLPDAVNTLRDGHWKMVAREQVEKNEVVLVRSGEVIPVDATIVQGSSAVKEDTFTGEHLPRAVTSGDTVYAGTINTEGALQVRVLGSYRDSRLAALQRSVNTAEFAKPRLATLADRLAAWFVGAILLITATTAAIWYQIDPQQALWVALSVLVISCPCALALATPAALANAASALRAGGVIVRGENALEALSRCTHILFDKTGTLTEGYLEVVQIETLANASTDQVMAIAAALQQYSNHPVSRAFVEADLANAPTTDLSNVVYEIGAGLEGIAKGTRYRMGSEQFCRALNKDLPAPPSPGLYWVALCSEDTPLAWFGLSDRTRDEAKSVINQAKQLGLVVGLLTGDSSAQGPLLAKQLGIHDVHCNMNPQQKMQHVQSLQHQGAVVVMVGDGLNDAPVLAVADSSFAVAGATDLARTQADFVIVGGDLWTVINTWRKACKCRKIILQNFSWALGYNMCAIPLAAMGFVPPWAAAIGMSLSSLLVVANSLRLNTRQSSLN